MGCRAYTPLSAEAQRPDREVHRETDHPCLCSHISVAPYCLWPHFLYVLDMDHPLHHLEDSCPGAGHRLPLCLYFPQHPVRRQSQVEFWSLRKRGRSVFSNLSLRICEMGAHRSTHPSLLLRSPVLMLVRGAWVGA